MAYVENRAVLHNRFAGFFFHSHGSLPFLFRRRRKSFGRLLGLTHLRKNPPGHFTVGRVARLHGNDVRTDGFSGQRKIPDDVENLVPDKFITVTQRFISEHRIVPNDDGVLQTTAFDQAVFKQVLNLFVITKRPGAGNVIAPCIGIHLDAEELREAAIISCAGAGDLKAVIRKCGHLRFTALQFNGGLELINISLRILCHNARLLDHLAVLRGTAVSYGRLIGIELDHGVVDTITGKRSEHVLHGMQLNVALGKRGGAIRFRNILHQSIDLRLAFEIHPTKADAMVGGRGQKGHVDLVAAVQANAAKAGLAGQCLLVEHVGI